MPVVPCMTRFSMPRPFQSFFRERLGKELGCHCPAESGEPATLVRGTGESTNLFVGGCRALSCALQIVSTTESASCDDLAFHSSCLIFLPRLPFTRFREHERRRRKQARRKSHLGKPYRKRRSPDEDPPRFWRPNPERPAPNPSQECRNPVDPEKLQQEVKEPGISNKELPHPLTSPDFLPLHPSCARLLRPPPSRPIN